VIKTRKSLSLLPRFPVLIFQRRPLTVPFFSRPGRNPSFRREMNFNFLTQESTTEHTLYGRLLRGVSSTEVNGMSLPIPVLRFRGFRVLQSMPARKSRALMACALPVRPWDHPGPSGFRLSSSPENDSHSRVAPLRHFDATLASCPGFTARTL
jgi:hypothetical protein